MTLFVFQNGSDEARQTKLIDITLGYMTIHELAEQFFINPNSNSKSVDAIVPCLSTIFGNIVCQRLAFIYSYSTALYVEEEHIGKSLFFTGQHSKGSVKFIQNRSSKSEISFTFVQAIFELIIVSNSVFFPRSRKLRKTYLRNNSVSFWKHSFKHGCLNT